MRRRRRNIHGMIRGNREYVGDDLSSRKSRRYLHRAPADIRYSRKSADSSPRHFPRNDTHPFKRIIYWRHIGATPMPGAISIVMPRREAPTPLPRTRFARMCVRVANLLLLNYRCNARVTGCTDDYHLSISRASNLPPIDRPSSMHNVMYIR